MTCATATVAFWEDAVETMDALAAWNDLLAANADLVVPARTAADIERAKEQGRTAILLGAQNASPLQGRLGFVRLFHDMGLRVMQLTYNNNTEFGGSCYEESDPGLTRFGREVVREMNAVGMLVDLSHSGERTRRDAIEHSALPVALTHANPVPCTTIRATRTTPRSRRSPPGTGSWASPRTAPSAGTTRAPWTTGARWWPARSTWSVCGTWP